MYNKVTVLGNLTRDIELRYLPSGSAIAKSAVATSYKYKTATGEQKDEVCFLDFNIFGRSAEVANQYLKKGSKVLLEGRLVFEQWTAQDGSSRSKHSLRVETMKMLDSKSDNSDHSEQTEQHYAPATATATAAQPQYAQPAPAAQPQQYAQPAQQQYAYPQIDIDEDEIPF